MLTKLKIRIIRTDVVERAHESFKNESEAHRKVNAKEEWNSMTLHGVTKCVKKND